MHDLEQASGNHEILKEVNHHVLVRKIGVEESRRNDTPDCERQGDWPGPANRAAASDQGIFLHRQRSPNLEERTEDPRP